MKLSGRLKLTLLAGALALFFLAVLVGVLPSVLANRPPNHALSNLTNVGATVLIAPRISSMMRAAGGFGVHAQGGSNTGHFVCRQADADC